MELQLYSDSLRWESQNYNNRFELKISDFLPAVRKVIFYVHGAGGRVVFYDGRPGSYVAITE